MSTDIFRLWSMLMQQEIAEITWSQMSFQGREDKMVWLFPSLSHFFSQQATESQTRHLMPS